MTNSRANGSSSDKSRHAKFTSLSSALCLPLRTVLRSLFVIARNLPEHRLTNYVRPQLDLAVYHAPTLCEYDLDMPTFERETRLQLSLVAKQSMNSHFRTPLGDFSTSTSHCNHLLRHARHFTSSLSCTQQILLNNKGSLPKKNLIHQIYIHNSNLYHCTPPTVPVRPRYIHVTYLART